jgi:hypothetical protein
MPALGRRRSRIWQWMSERLVAQFVHMACHSDLSRRILRPPVFGWSAVDKRARRCPARPSGSSLWPLGRQIALI